MNPTFFLGIETSCDETAAAVFTDEPVVLAPVPDGEGHVMIDGSHRATVRIRAGLSVEAFLLTPVESALAVVSAAIEPATITS